MIYFIAETGRVDNRVKIGFTSKDDIQERFLSLASNSSCELRVLFTAKGTEKTERKLHAKFDKDRLYGEWFHYSDEIKNFLAEYKDINTLEVSDSVQNKIIIKLVPKADDPIFEYIRKHHTCSPSYALKVLIHTCLSKLGGE